MADTNPELKAERAAVAPPTSPSLRALTLDQLIALVEKLPRYNCDCLPNGPDGKTMATDEENHAGDIYGCNRWVVLASDLEAAIGVVWTIRGEEKETVEIERLRAAPPTWTPDWQPIESAPKDGQSILVVAQHGFYVVSWQTDPIDWWFVDDNKQGPFALRGSSPTHWAALPIPPQADKEPK